MPTRPAVDRLAAALGDGDGDPDAGTFHVTPGPRWGEYRARRPAGGFRGVRIESRHPSRQGVVRCVERFSSACSVA